MIAVIRVFLALILLVGICIFGIIYCLFYFKKSYRAATISHMFGYIAPIFGITVEIRKQSNFDVSKAYIYIANHQNNYDMVTVSYIVPFNTITVGKRNLLWIPLFGQLYWLSGNILVNRSRSTQKSYSVLRKITDTIKMHNISVWIFPEGTRNYGKGLLPFKTGAFCAAILSGVSIVPVCVSNLSNNKIRLNRWSNGLVIIEMLPPIIVNNCDLQQVRRITAYCHKIMELKIQDLNQEVLSRDG